VPDDRLSRSWDELGEPGELPCRADHTKLCFDQPPRILRNELAESGERRLVVDAAGCV
jgi:hypothetical protein